MLRAIDACPKPVVVLAHGAAIGGGVGLVATADIAIAAEGTVFSLAEVKLGILPSVISPYVLRAIGPRSARDLFLTGDRFDAAEALRIGLVHGVVPASELEEAGRKKIASLLTSGPEAVGVAKRLIEEVAGRTPEEAMALTVRTIAERRASAEAKEGLTAFLEKRKPSWAKEQES
jgi:methylglutaconyl-CoA hydratase